MKVENPVAYSFIMQDDIYLLADDKSLYADTKASEATERASEPQETYTKQPAAIAPEPAPVLKQLGANKKGYLIITFYPDNEFIRQDHLTALESTLGRLNYALDDVAIVNRSKFPDTTFSALKAFFKPEKVLLLGKESLPAGMEAIPLNQQKQTDGIPTLRTFSFDEMMDNVDNKKAFWAQIKQF
ncbi:MAG TPA: hypothetical protein VHA56_14145 [Mucilaginibacter sp.]|nr:hypothetical protein [Mucilaginibacter sp.]